MMTKTEVNDFLIRNYTVPVETISNNIFFLVRKKELALIKIVRSLLGLFRDFLLLKRRSCQNSLNSEVVFVVSEPGMSGIGCLRPLIKEYRRIGVNVSLIVKPGVDFETEGLPVILIGGVSFSDFIKLILKVRISKRKRFCFLDILVYIATLRANIWNYAIRRSMPKSRVVYVHNDFDFVGANAVRISKENKKHTICIQHGLPTAEFFPPNADIHVVWGEAFEKLYKRKSNDVKVFIRSDIERLSLGDGVNDQNIPPREIVLVSQTHATVFGFDIKAEFKKILEKYFSSSCKLPIKVLLHPREQDDWLGEHPHIVFSHPPHLELQDSCDSKVVVGFCSTALFECASRGHYVIGLDWGNKTEEDIEMITPPFKVSSLSEAADIVEKLHCDSVYRKEFSGILNDWLSSVAERNLSTSEIVGKIREICKVV